MGEIRFDEIDETILMSRDGAALSEESFFWVARKLARSGLSAEEVLVGLAKLALRIAQDNGCLYMARDIVAGALDAEPTIERGFTKR